MADRIYPKRFLRYLPEDSQANPGVYGFELAHWLSVELMKQNIPTSYPLGEDWGWFIEYLNDGIEIMICCSSQADHGAGYKDAPIAWTIFIRSPRGFFRKSKGPEHEKAVSMLSENITKLLQKEGISFERVEA